jgi:hypothetical protein
LEHIAKHQLLKLEELSDRKKQIIDGKYRKGDVYDFLQNENLAYIHYDNFPEGRFLCIEITEKGLAFLANAKFEEKSLKWASFRSWLALIVAIAAIIVQL